MVNTEIRHYILYSWRWRSSIQSAKTRSGADCGSDHELLIEKIRLFEASGENHRPLRYDLNQIPYNYAVEVTNEFCFIDYAEALIVWITTNRGKFLERWEYQTTLPASWETCMGQEATVGTMDWLKIGKGVTQAVYLSYLSYVTSMQSTSYEMVVWNQDCWEKCQQLQICRWYHSSGRNEEELKSLRVKQESEKAGLILNIQKLRSWHSVPSRQGK